MLPFLQPPTLHGNSQPIHNFSWPVVSAQQLQGLTHARITFKNEATGEYTFYELKLTSSAPAPMGQLVMECPCFSKTSTTISITNPLATQVPLKFSCTSKQVCFAHRCRAALACPQLVLTGAHQRLLLLLLCIRLAVMPWLVSSDAVGKCLTPSRVSRTTCPCR